MFSRQISIPHRSRCKAWLLALPLLLGGCAALQPPSTPASVASAGARPYHDAIELGGRLSVRYQQNGKEEALHGTFSWTQSRQQTNITLSSPLGQTLATIALTPDGATLTQSGQAPRTAADVDALALDALGWPLPVAGLRDWLQGFASNPTGQRVLASPENSELRTADGWYLHYDAWQDDDAQQQRPKRIDLTRRTPHAGDVALRIVIDNWQPQ